MTIFDRTQSFALVVGTRGFFNSGLVREVREGAINAIESAGHAVVVLPESATPNGAVESLAQGQVDRLAHGQLSRRHAVTGRWQKVDPEPIPGSIPAQPTTASVDRVG